MRNRSILTALVCVVVLLSGSVAPVAAASSQSNAYAGTNVSFTTDGNAVVDYAVDGATVAQSMKVQSASGATDGGLVGVGADLSAVTHLDGSAVTLDSKTQVRASVKTQSGATLTAHDDGRGELVVDAGGRSQYVTANLSSGASASTGGDGQVVVTAADGTKGTFLVTGDGSVTVNDAGNVAAKLGSDGKLVFRAYPNGRSAADRHQEQLISDGTAAAGVYVMPTAQGSSDLATDVVSYGSDTSVSVAQASQGTVQLTADRTSHDGRVIITTVSKQAISSTDHLQVSVDGKAAAKASSYAELEQAAKGGDASKYLVRGDASAKASADVLVGINHFSSRQVTMAESGSGGTTSSGTGSTTSGESGGGTTSGSGGSAGGSGGAASPGQPGFGVIVSLLALLVVAAVARYRS